jgi:hypothetical protein
MIEYNNPSASSNTLTYQIKQLEYNLNNGDLTKLHSSPFILIPGTTSYYTPLQVAIKFNCTNVNTGINYFIGYESLLGVNINSYYCTFDTAYFGGSSTQFMSLGIKYQNYWINTSKTNEPLVLWEQIDDNLANFTNFQIIVTYIDYTI